MELIYNFDGLQALAQTMLDSLWQGILVLLFLLLMDRLLPIQYGQLKYRIGIFALIGFFVWNVNSFLYYQGNNNDESISELAITELDQGSVFLISGGETGIWDQTYSMIQVVRSFANDNAEFVLVGWLIGIVLLTMRLCGGLLYLKRMKTDSRIIDSQDIEVRLKELSDRLGLKKVPSILESVKVNAPLTIGIISPVIIVPTGILTGIPYQQLESILIHELIHIKKKDYLVNLLQHGMEIVYFFNPAVWIISRLISKHREYRCDQQTLKYVENKSVYAQALTYFYERSMNKNDQIEFAIHSVKTQVFNRIKSIIMFKNEYTRLSGMRMTIVILFVLFSGLIFGFTSVKSVDGIAESTNKFTTNIQGAKEPDLSNESLQPLDTFNHDQDEKIKRKVLKTPKSLRVRVPSDSTDMEKALYIVNGKRIRYSELTAFLKGKTINSMSIHKGEQAIGKYGEDAKNGAVEIHTESNNIDGNEIEFNLSELPKERIKELDGNVSVTKVDDNFKTKPNQADSIPKQTGNNTIPDNVTYVLDGKVIKKRKLEKLNPGEIKSINVLKGEAAKSKGYKNTQGVIVIKTKRKNKSTEEESESDRKIKISEEPPVKHAKEALRISAIGNRDEIVEIPPIHDSPKFKEPKPPVPEQPPVESKIDDLLTLFPNPAKSSMKVRYELENDGRVNIGIYSISGERLATIEENVYKKAGSHTTDLGDTLKNLPRHRSYIIKLQTEKMTISKQFLLEN